MTRSGIGPCLEFQRIAAATDEVKKNLTEIGHEAAKSIRRRLLAILRSNDDKERLKSTLQAL